YFYCFFILTLRPPPTSTSFPYTTLFRSGAAACATLELAAAAVEAGAAAAVLVYRAFNERSGQRYGQPMSVTTSESGHYHVHGLRSEEHTSELQSRENLVCRLLLEKKKAS